MFSLLLPLSQEMNLMIFSTIILLVPFPHLNLVKILLFYFEMETKRRSKSHTLLYFIYDKKKKSSLLLVYSFTCCD